MRASPRAATGGPSSPLACRGSGAPPGVWRCAAGWSAPSRAAGYRHHLPVLASESGSSVSVAHWRRGRFAKGKKADESLGMVLPVAAPARLVTVTSARL